jgi:RimK-like ATP-grasp domain
VTALLWGVPSEPPMAMVARELAALDADVIMLHPWATPDLHVRVQVGAGDRSAPLAGSLRSGGRWVDLAEVSGAYLRPVEPELAPELRGRPESARLLAQARRTYDALVGFTETAPRFTGCRVANRLSAMASNASKPYQAQVVVRHGFATPETLVSTDPEEVLDFVARHREVVYKSCSGVRSVVTPFDPAVDRARLDLIKWCPVQFQERVRGPDVRVHVVGDEVYAARIESTAVDYRYARMQVGADARLGRWRLDDDVAGRCVALASALDLPFAGIDLKLPPDGRVVCFEVNPSPGFSWFENETGLPIARAVARWLLSDTTVTRG